MIKATNETLFDIIDEHMDNFGRDVDLNHIDVSACTRMSHVINGVWCGLFEAGRRSKKSNETFCGDVSKWNMSNVKNMLLMFEGCKDFNCDLSKWDVHNVEMMQKAFHECHNFNCDISKWDVRHCLVFTRTFKNTSLFCDLSGWETIDNKHESALFGTPMWKNYKMWPERWRP